MKAFDVLGVEYRVGHGHGWHEPGNFAMFDDDEFARSVHGDDFGLKRVAFARGRLTGGKHSRNTEEQKQKAEDLEALRASGVAVRRSYDFVLNPNITFHPGSLVLSVVKTIAHLNEDFARIHVMRAAEGEAVVQQDAAIGDVQTGDAERKSLGEIFAERQVKGCVPGQVARRRTSVCES